METYSFEAVGQLTTFAVPQCADVIEIEVFGGAGGQVTSVQTGVTTTGRGGYVYDPFYPVTPGSTLNIYVGGRGNLHIGGKNGAGVGNGQGGNGIPGGGGGGGGAATLGKATGSMYSKLT